MSAAVDALSDSIYREFREKGAVGIDKVATPPVWNEPVDVKGLIVEVGRREDDVLFHFWFERFPKDFSERLEKAIEDVGLIPSRFEASETDELRALWGGTNLVVGPKDQVENMARPRSFRLLRTWAVKARDYAVSDRANEILCGPFVEKVLEALE